MIAALRVSVSCIHFTLMVLKETLWIVKNAKLFGTEAGDVYQAS